MELGLNALICTGRDGAAGGPGQRPAGRAEGRYEPAAGRGAAVGSADGLAAASHQRAADALGAGPLRVRRREQQANADDHQPGQFCAADARELQSNPLLFTPISLVFFFLFHLRAKSNQWILTLKKKKNFF